MLGSLKTTPLPALPDRPLWLWALLCLCLLGEGTQAQPPLITTQVSFLPCPRRVGVGTVCLLVGTSFCLSPFFSSLYLLFSLSLLCLGLFSSSSLASSSSLHLLLPSWLLVLPVPLMCLLGWGIKVSLPLALGPFQLSIPTAPLRPPKMGASRGGGRFWHSTPQFQAWAQGFFPCLSVYLTPAIWGGYWATTTTTRRSVLLCPVADRKT